MNKITPPDISARKKIEKELHKNFLVEAGAGSGKTSSLVKRMVALVVKGNYKAGEIAAITFTRKAASELKQRFQTRLEKEYCTMSDEIKKERIENALQNLEQCFLGTIHSFCAQLLRERPVEAGIDPEFQEMDEIENNLLIEKAWEEYLLQIKLSHPEIMEQLNFIGIAPNELKPAFMRLSDFPEVNVVYEQTEKPDLKDAFETTKDLIDRAQNAIPKDPVEGRYDKLQETILKVQRYIKYFDLTQEKNMVRLLLNFEKECKITQKLWNSKEKAKQFKDEFDNLANNVVSPVIKKWREYCHYYLMEFLLPAVKYYENMRREQSYLNFQDLLMKTAEMLKNYPEVRDYFKQKYKCLLVDEFQDTDPIQSEIMFYLTGCNSEEINWQKLKPIPGALFIVGDPKQSIYRFRRADIDTYNLIKKLLSESGGEVLNLTANFRSLNTLGNYYNTVFRNMLPEESSYYQAGFRSMDTILPDENNNISGVKIMEIPADFNNKTDIVKEDAGRIAHYIKWALEGNIKLSRTQEETEEGAEEKPRPKDFLIIMRYKDSMDVYARALEDYGIPVSISGGSSLSKSHEINELIMVLKVLAEIDNQVNLTAVLRGLFFGISDDALYKFKCAGGSFNIYSPVPKELDDEVREIFEEAFVRLKKYYIWTKEYTPVVALEKIIIDLGLIPYTLTGNMVKSRCSYIYQILEHLIKAEIDGVAGFSQMVKHFENILDADLEEELNILVGEEDAVRIMNLHKSKGLEAGVVFLAHPYKNVSFDPAEHIIRLNEKPQGYFVIKRDKNQHNKETIGQPKNWQSYSEEEQKYINAEEERLKYVAATRAKNLLVISRNLKDKNMSKNPWAPLLREIIEEDNTLGIPDGNEVNKNEIKEGEVEVTNNILKQKMQETEEIITNLKKPCYTENTPTGMKKDKKYLQITRMSGGGMDWGNAVHKVFEELIKATDDLDTVINIVLEENDISMDKKDEVYQSINDFKKSRLWARIEKSQNVYTEAPFSIKIEKDNELYDLVKEENEQDCPVILNGVIDLAFKDADGWVVVDYKTDRPEKEEDYDILLDAYSKQVLIYSKVWEEITREEVKSGEIYFTSLRDTKRVYEQN